MEFDKYNSNPVRELLRLSQSNITTDPEAGYAYAVQAYVAAQDPQVKDADPTAMAEAAAKAGFRGEQAGHPASEVVDWFNESYHALPNDWQGKREKIATHLLEGRSLSLRLINNTFAGIEQYDVNLAQRASESFDNGEEILIEQHLIGRRWDKYGTMLSRHRATHEAIFGKNSLAATSAIRGLWRALKADKENQQSKEHYAFVTKQVGSNAIAGILVLSRPLDRVPLLNKGRKKLALWLLG